MKFILGFLAAVILDLTGDALVWMLYGKKRWDICPECGAPKIGMLRHFIRVKRRKVK